MYKIEEFRERERERDEYVLIIPRNASHVLCARIIAFFDGNDDAQ